MKIDNVVKGKFLFEAKNRFKGNAIISATEQEVYVSSSVKLSNFIDTSNKAALFKKIEGTEKYKLIAIDCGNDGRYSIVDLTLINTIVKEYYEAQGIKVDTEKIIINNYKIDIWIEKINCGIEIKSVLLDLNREFPFHNTERIYKQLDSINDLLEKGVMVKLLFVCNNDIKKISFNKNDEKFIKKITKAIKSGLIIEYWYLFSDDLGNCFIKQICNENISNLCKNML